MEKAFIKTDWEVLSMRHRGPEFIEACISALDDEFKTASHWDNVDDLDWAYAISDELDRIHEVAVWIGKSHYRAALDQDFDYSTPEESVRSHLVNLLDTLDSCPKLSCWAEDAFIDADRAASEVA